MRYVIGILVLTGFIIWDGAVNDGRYLTTFLRSLNGLVHSVTG